METGASTPRQDNLIEVVIHLLETEGYDAVQVRTVAKRARVSLRTMYDLFATRDDLIVAGLIRWMDRHVYSNISRPDPDLPVREALLGMYRQLFAPWVRNPLMLEAYHRARTSAGGHALDRQGRSVLSPIAEEVLGRLDPAYAEDLGIILNNVFYSVVARAAEGRLPSEEIMNVLERTLTRITSDNSALAAPTTPRPDPSGARRRLPVDHEQPDQGQPR